MIRFKVWGALRFLSHAEMLRLFQRACVRAGVSIRYSQGFNPRPKLSLPLPRPVGVESDDELLCLSVHGNAGDSGDPCSLIAAGLSSQLPAGCLLLSVMFSPLGGSIQPRAATYLLPAEREHLNDKLRATIDSLLASESLNVRRQGAPGGRRARNIDVRPFLTSIRMTADGIIIECKICPAGSIRVDEILSLLELDQDMLAGPIRRTNVCWC